MAAWQVVHRNVERERVLVQSGEWTDSRKAFSEIMSARCRAEKVDATRYEHYRLTRFRLEALTPNTEFRWLSLDEREIIALVYSSAVQADFETTRRARRRIARSVSDPDQMQAPTPSVEEAVLRATATDDTPMPDSFLNEPASISRLESDER